MTETAANRAAYAILATVCLFVSGCSAFALPRSAEVRPGPSLSIAAVAATPPGDAASWFFSIYCTSGCNRAMFTPAVSFLYGTAGADGVGRAEYGFGINGVVPYIEAYRRVDGGTGRAFGFGARAGALDESRQGQLYARIDLRRNGDRTTFLNPTWFGHFYRDQWFQAVGTAIGTEEVDGASSSLTLAVTPMLGWARRGRYAPEAERSAFSAFVLLSATVTMHRAAPD